MNLNEKKGKHEHLEEILNDYLHINLHINSHELQYKIQLYALYLYKHLF